MNNVSLIGRLTKDVELKKTPNGKSVVQFTLAVTRTKDESDFISCVAWNTTADSMNQFLHKGSLIGLTGSIQTRYYDNKKGERVYITEVLVNRIYFLEPKSNVQSQNKVDNINTYQNQNNARNAFNGYSESLTEMAEREAFNSDLDIASDDLPF